MMPRGSYWNKKKLSIASDHHKVIYIFQDLSLFLQKKTVPKLFKDKFCNLGCLVCHIQKSIVQHKKITTHSSMATYPKQ